jgi:hypothetical protein
MSQLRSDDGFAGRGDDFYERLVAAHRGLGDAASGALNAKLVLLLANHIGDLAVIDQALSAARGGPAPGADAPRGERE